MAGQLLVIEGLDGSGKATQSRLLSNFYSASGVANRLVSFPDYESPSSSLIQYYLSGALGSAGAVNAYAASSFYAADRYISYHTKWKADYEQEVVIIADRYTTSNLIYQMAKLPEAQWQEYIAWSDDFEFVKLGLPAPSRVIYLDVEPAVSQELLWQRYGGDTSKKDIHENDFAYLLQCRKAALYLCKTQHWSLVPCTHNGAMQPVEAVARLIQHAAQL